MYGRSCGAGELGSAGKGAKRRSRRFFEFFSAEKYPAEHYITWFFSRQVFFVEKNPTATLLGAVFLC
jgi:hypothetical protein